MAKYIHNISEEAKTYQGREVDADAFFLIESSWEADYMSCAPLIADLANGVVKMSANGTTDLTGGASAHVDFLKGLDLTPRDTDGAPLSRNKITASGWAMQLHGVEFKTAQLDSFYSKNHDASPSGVDFGFGAMKFFKDNGAGGLAECADQADADTNCIATQVDWEPTHDYEILGGALKQLTTPTEDVRVWVIGVPDVPYANGGSKAFVVSMNLRYLDGSGITVDGKAPKYLTYNATYHTNKVRLFFRHPAGFKHPMMMVFQIFKP